MNGSIVELDVHGMTLCQAQIAVDAALRRAEKYAAAIKLLSDPD